MRRTPLSILMLFVTILNGCLGFLGAHSERDEETFVRTHLHKAAEHERGGDHLEALKHYKIALTVDQTNPQATAGQIRAESSLKHSAEERYRRGLEAQKEGKHDAAQREFLTALRLRPGYVEALEKVAPGKEPSAKAYVSHKVRPGDSLSLLALAYYGDPQRYPVIARYNNLRDAGLIRVGQVIRIPDSSVVRCPPNRTGTRGPLEPQAKSLEGEAVAEERVDTVTVYREQGIELFGEKKFEEAMAEFKKVLSVRAKDSVAREYSCKSTFEIAMALLDSGEYLLARDKFKESLGYQSDCMKCEIYVRKSEDLYKETHYKKGMQCYGKEQLVEAILEWEMVRNLDPNYKRVGDYIQKAKELKKKLEELKIELEEGSAKTRES